MEWFKREWPNILTIGCIVVAALIEAWQQALAGSPKVAEMLPSLDGGWHYVPFVLLTVAGISWFVGRFRKQPPQGQPQGGGLQTTLGVSLQPPVEFDATQFFRTAYHSDWTADVERRIRVAAHQNQPGDHEAFYAKFIGVGVVSYAHDITWAYIFRSQLLMLMELNRNGGLLPMTNARAYYDRVAAEHPAMYSHYSFDQWMAFIESQQLLIHHPSEMLEITIRGKDFLKYLTHRGWYPDARKF